MPREPLPKSLSYLSPIKKLLASLTRDERPQDIDPSVFQNLIQKRINGLSVEQAKKTLRDDHEKLEQWLGEPGRQNNPLNFILGFLMIASERPEKFQEPSFEQSAQDEVEMQFPPEARVKKQGLVWKARWRGWTLFVLPCDKTAFDSEIESFREPVRQYANLIAVSLTPVQFGAVSGFKKVTVITELGSKNAEYALTVPGGYVSATLFKKGTDWEEATLDQYFSTIQIIKRTKP